MRTKIACLSVLSSFACLTSAHAHPGHAVETTDSTSVAHYLTHPDHLSYYLLAFVIASAVAVGVFAARRRLAPAYARVRKHR